MSTRPTLLLLGGLLGLGLVLVLVPPARDTHEGAALGPSPSPAPTGYTPVDKRTAALAAIALERFTPETQAALSSIELVFGATRTAYSSIGSGPPLIVLSRDNWGGLDQAFKLNLLVHEYLHHAVVLRHVDMQGFCAALGSNPPTGYLGMLLDWVRRQYPLGRCPYGTEEYAYIGEQLANGAPERKDEAPALLPFYSRVLVSTLLKGHSIGGEVGCGLPSALLGDAGRRGDVVGTPTRQHAPKGRLPDLEATLQAD